MRYAARYPDHPGGLILSSSSAREDTPRALRHFERLGGAPAREAAAAFYERPDPATYRAFERICMPLYSRTKRPAEAASRHIEHQELLFHFWGGEMRSLNLLSELVRVRCPTLVLAGTADPITPVADAEEIAAALPVELVRFRRFEGQGHALFRDEPQAYFDELRAFLAQVFCPEGDDSAA